MMCLESLIAIIWAAAAMAFFNGYNGAGNSIAGLNAALADNGNDASWAVNTITNTTLGKFGAILALLGVVAAPITSGDTAFRSSRLIVADFLGMEQIEGDAPGFNDGTERDAPFELVEYLPDYSEGTEEMVLVNQAGRGGQAQTAAPGKMDTGLKDYNIIRKNGLYGVCNRHKRVIIQPVYEDMHPYFNGLIPFKQNGKWGIMYGNGTIAVRPKYYNIGPFTDGLAEVQNTMDSQPYRINGKMQRVSS